MIPAKKESAAKDDVVFTPRPLAKRIIESLPLEGTVLEPCRGSGAFFDQLPDHTTNLFCEVAEGKDFFKFDQHVDWIITNPPWSIYRYFLNHAYTLAGDIAILAPIQYTIGLKARLRDMREAGFGVVSIMTVESPRPSESDGELDWPSMGLQLGVVWYRKGYTGRIKFGEL